MRSIVELIAAHSCTIWLLHRVLRVSTDGRKALLIMQDPPTPYLSPLFVWETSSTRKHKGLWPLIKARNGRRKTTTCYFMRQARTRASTSKMPSARWLNKLFRETPSNNTLAPAWWAREAKLNWTQKTQTSRQRLRNLVAADTIISIQ
jgi:hypothetical protein